jgi:hypothetical protein
VAAESDGPGQLLKNLGGWFDRPTDQTILFFENPPAGTPHHFLDPEIGDRRIQIPHEALISAAGIFLT